MIRVYRWDAEQHGGSWLTGAEVKDRIEELRSESSVLWIDLDGPSEEEERLVFESLFPVHPLSLEDVTRLRRLPDQPPHFPKVEEFPDYLLVIVNPLAHSLTESRKDDADKSGIFPTDTSPVVQLSAILSRRVLITHHYEPIRGVEELRGFLTRHGGSAGRGPDYLFHLILDEMVDEYAPVLDALEATLDEYETQLFKNPSHRMLAHMIQCKRAIVVLRKTLIYEREILARLARREFDLIDEREAVYYRNVYDHVIRFTELIESSREMVTDLLEMHLAASSYRLNEIMKVLTMISTTVLPMTLVAGIYGMNYDESAWPNFKSAWGFWFALGLMLFSGASSFTYFKWKKWI